MYRRTSPRLRAWRIVVRLLPLAVVVCLFNAAPSAAILVKLPNGHYANYDPMTGSKAPKIVSKFDAAFTNLDYSGGPVMPSNTNYTVEWLPSNYGSHTPFQTGYVSGVNTFFADMAHDSGRATNSDAVSIQYNDVFGNTAAYSFTNGGQLLDTDPLPSNGCPVANSSEICLTDAQIQSELNKFLSGHAHDLSHEYYLLTPPDVASCFDSTGSVCSANVDPSVDTPYFCAYHSTSSGGFIYSNIPDLTGVDGCDPFVTYWYDCPSFSCSYDNGPADGMLSAISHEHNESITDPQPNNAWTDWGSSVGGEIGDKCNGDAFADPNLQFGGGSGDQPYNETVNGDHYLLQREWSNQTAQCLDSFVPNGTAAKASFTSSSGSGNTVNFDASASTATGGVADYVWQFNDGPGQTATVETTSPTISHTFPASGTYDVALTVMATDGTSNGTANNATAGASSAPRAAFSAPTGLEGTSLTFDGSSSTGSITSYSWNFGDGTTGSGAVAHHTYAKYGNYTATLTVSGSGGSNSVSHTVVVTDETPTSSFTFSPGSPRVGTSVGFSGSGSDSDGTIVGWHWTFGDGGTSNTQNPSHTYIPAGTYSVTLTVTDSDGQTGSSSQAITVTPAFQNPTAAFSAPSGGLEGQALTFNASGSSDPNSGGSLSYSWNFGDGSSGSGATISHGFATGVYTITLTVTDSASGLTNSVSHTVTIADESPTAGLFQASGTAGSPVAFTGFGSDPDGTLASFLWSFGDGGSASGANPTHVYAHAGTYTVTVTIVDSAGRTASASESVTIAPAPTHGPQQPNCVVPKLKGKTMSVARKLLAAAHCKLGKVKTPHKPKRSAGRHHKWELVVAKQSPPAGRIEPNDTRISLTLTYRAVKTH